MALVAVAFGGTATTLAAPTGAGMALVRLVHASPDAPAIDVAVDGQRVVSAMKFTDATSYVSPPAGSHAVQVFSSAADPCPAALLSTTVEFKEGIAYTIVASDRLAQLGAVVLTDDLATSAGSQDYVRLVRASPDAPSVADVAVVGGPVAYRDLVYKATSPYLPIAPGTYAFAVRPAGTTKALATPGQLTPEAGRLYSAFVVGQLRDNTFQELLVPDNAGAGGVAAVPSTGGGASRAFDPTLAMSLLAGGLLLGMVAVARSLRPRAAQER